jgi:hypothetical protein
MIASRFRRVNIFDIEGWFKLNSGSVKLTAHLKKRKAPVEGVNSRLTSKNSETELKLRLLKLEKRMYTLFVVFGLLLSVLFVLWLVFMWLG